MPSTDPDEDILEIIDQRPPPASPAKYLVLGVVGLAFIFFSYRLLLHFTPREIAGAAVSPLEKGAALTGRFFDHLTQFVTSSRTSTQVEVQVGRVSPTDKSGPLIVAQQEIALRFTNVDEHLFGTSTAEVRAAGKAYYYVPLLGTDAVWRLETLERDGVRVCVVHAPALRVLTPVSLDSRSLELRTNTGVLRTNTREMTAAALADITPRLNHAALDQTAAARAAARKTIAAFVKTWLSEANSWGPAKINAIQVLFPDESAVDTDFAIPGFYDRK